MSDSSGNHVSPLEVMRIVMETTTDPVLRLDAANKLATAEMRLTALDKEVETGVGISFILDVTSPEEESVLEDLTQEVTYGEDSLIGSSYLQSGPDSETLPREQ